MFSKSLSFRIPTFPFQLRFVSQNGAKKKGLGTQLACQSPQRFLECSILLPNPLLVDSILAVLALHPHGILCPLESLGLPHSFFIRLDVVSIPPPFVPFSYDTTQPGRNVSVFVPKPHRFQQNFPSLYFWITASVFLSRKCPLHPIAR